MRINEHVTYWLEESSCESKRNSPCYRIRLALSIHSKELLQTGPTWRQICHYLGMRALKLCDQCCIMQNIPDEDFEVVETSQWNVNQFVVSDRNIWSGQSAIFLTSSSWSSWPRPPMSSDLTRHKLQSRLRSSDASDLTKPFKHCVASSSMRMPYSWFHTWPATMWLCMNMKARALRTGDNVWVLILPRPFPSFGKVVWLWCWSMLWVRGSESNRHRSPAFCMRDTNFLSDVLSWKIGCCDSACKWVSSALFRWYCSSSLLEPDSSNWQEQHLLYATLRGHLSEVPLDMSRQGGCIGLAHAFWEWQWSCWWSQRSIDPVQPVESLRYLSLPIETTQQSLMPDLTITCSSELVSLCSSFELVVYSESQSSSWCFLSPSWKNQPDCESVAEQFARCYVVVVAIALLNANTKRIV